MDTYSFKQTLSPARARAFAQALSELNDSISSDQTKALWSELDLMKREWFAKNHVEIADITAKADLERRTIEAQIQALREQANQIQREAQEKVDLIRYGLYQTPEYQEVEAKRRESALNDRAIHDPKVIALMDKYAKAQQEADSRKSA